MAMARRVTQPPPPPPEEKVELMLSLSEARSLLSLVANNLYITRRQDSIDLYDIHNALLAVH
jgi:hypothetical protein